MIPNHLPRMNRLKTLSVPLISAFFAVGILPSSGQLSLTISSRISYRQDNQRVNFQGGTFDMDMIDGNLISEVPCNSFSYYPPGDAGGACALGTGAYLTQGTLNGISLQRPYLVVRSLSPASQIEPFQADLAALTSAPMSTLPRPIVGFVDNSALVYYNLNATDIRQYKFTHYNFALNYGKGESSRFRGEIVPDVYGFTFPGLIPEGTDFYYRPAALSAVVRPMVEGFAKINNTDSGVKYTSINGQFKFSNRGYVEMSYFRPNIIRWIGFSRDTVFSGVDTLYFSMRPLLDIKNPATSGLVESKSIFPSFDNGIDTRVVLTSPFQNSFTVPPIFPSGTEAMVELELQRNAQTGGISYDRSSRKFQIPVVVVNRYDEYTGISLAGTPSKNILADPDKDGYNNLVEWILGSNAADKGSIPMAPLPAAFQAEDDTGKATTFGSYFGFNVNIQVATVPRVTYILQRSKNQGKTWQRFKTDGDWEVTHVTNVTNYVQTKQIQVRSKQLVSPITPATTNYYTQPTGTLNHIYRVKIVLKK